MGAIAFPRSIGPVFLDVVVAEDFESALEVPSHPVESGAKISDHAFREPDTLKMECLNTDVTDTLRALRDLQALAEPFDILTGFDLHESMVITNIAAHRDVIFGQVLSVQVSLKEVIIVESAVTPGQAPSGQGGDERAKGKASRGPVQPRPVGTTTGRGRSLGGSIPGASTLA